MRVFQEWEVSLEGHSFAELVSLIERATSEPWTRNKVREEEVWGHNNQDAACFRHDDTAGDNLPAADLWINKQSNRAYVSNIVPFKTSQMSRDAYNAILRLFVQQLGQPAAAKLGLTPSLSKEDVALSDVLPNDVAQALQSFSRLANKSTGSSHPMDQQRWNRFLILLHKSQASADTELISRWLKKDGWNGDKALDLVIQLEQAMSLLKQYDREGA